MSYGERFEASGKRFAALGEAGILPATPLSVVLELFADYCYGLVATLYRGADALGQRLAAAAVAVVAKIGTIGSTGMMWQYTCSRRRKHLIL